MTAIDLIRAHSNLDDAREACQRGVITWPEFQKFCRCWYWSAVRQSGGAGAWQDAYARKHGCSGLRERIDRMQRVVLRLAQGKDGAS